MKKNGSRVMSAISLLGGIGLLSTCATAPRALVRFTVEAEASFADLPGKDPRDPSGLPSGLAAVLPGTKALIIGEQHYQVEHQEYWGGAAGALADSGFLLLAQEGMSSLGWIARAYSTGDWPAGRPLPQPISGFEREFLNRIRLANRDRIARGSPPLAYDYFDMNHWKDCLFISVAEMVGCARDEGNPEAAKALADLWEKPEAAYRASPDSKNYEAAVNELAALLETEGDARVAALGPRWRERLREAVRLEIESIPLRASFKDDAREAFIKKRIAELLSLAPGGRIAINCGMWHAQKRKVKGSNSEWLGTWLARGLCPGIGPDEVFSIACGSLRGEEKASFYSRERKAFDLSARAAPNDLVRALGEAAGERIGFLQLSSFSARKAVLGATFGPERWILRAPYPFDAVLCYPRMTIAASTEAFER
jgi:hypothetical protein